MTIRRVLLVCSGNTCRSPMAAAMLAELWRKSGQPWDLEVRSAGTGAFPGSPATEHALAAMRRRGLDLTGHRAEAVSDRLLDEVDLVLTMTQRHKESVLLLRPDLRGRVYSLGEFTGSPSDVPDPFGGPLSLYEETVKRMEPLLQAVAQRIRKEAATGMKVAVGCDHGGIELKEAVVAALKTLNIDYEDMGTYDRNSCDYPDFAQKVGAAVTSGQFQQGILICGTGIGMSIAANKVPGIRAALCNEVFSARMARAHNDANILCLGARVVGAGVAGEIVTAYFSGSFEGGRHARRVEKIGALEGKR